MRQMMDVVGSYDRDQDFQRQKEDSKDNVAINAHVIPARVPASARLRRDEYTNIIAFSRQ